MIQYKLCKVFNENKSEIIKKLDVIYGVENLCFISDNIIGISYVYGSKNYKHILKSIMKLKMSQVIITSNIFTKLLNYSIDNNYFITHISFLDSISVEDKEFVNHQINLLNREGNLISKVKLKNILNNELQWLTSDGGIDIKSMVLTIKMESGLYSNISIYNNGVLLIDNVLIMDELIKLIRFVVV